MMRALGATLLVPLVVACGGGHYVYVLNGGVAVPSGSCTDVALAADDLAVVVAGAPECDKKPGFLLPKHAAAAFWQVQGPPWAGPVIAPEASVEMEVERKLETGTNEKRLTTGTGEKALVSGTGEKGLTTGSSDKALTEGVAERKLTQGTGEKALTTASSDKKLTEGVAEKKLTAAAAEVAPLTLSKRGDGRASKTAAASYSLTVANVSDVPLRTVTLVDRVDAALRVDAPSATTTALADGSTLVTFRLVEPLGAHATRTVTFDVYAR